MNRRDGTVVDGFTFDAEGNLRAGTAEPQDVLVAAGPSLQFPTGVCFGAEDLRTVYVGSLAIRPLVRLGPFAVARFRQGLTSSRENRGGSRPAPPR